MPRVESPLQHAPAGIDPTLVHAAVTTREGGVSTGRFASLNLGFHVGDDGDAVLANRLRAATTFGAPLGDFVFAEQVGGMTATRVGLGDRGRGAWVRETAVPATDALVTTEPGVVLALLAADCMLIALHDPMANVLGLAHAGWQGATGGVVRETVRVMREAGANPSTTVAWIGPAVPADRYQVGEPVADAALASLGSKVTSALRADGTGRYLFDLPAAARVQLLRAGLAEENILRTDEVTGPGTPYFSHRLEGPTGRFALFARLLPRDGGES